MEKIQAGNTVYYANSHVFKSNLISRNSKTDISNAGMTGGDI
jgi:hypothetical protein